MDNLEIIVEKVLKELMLKENSVIQGYSHDSVDKAVEMAGIAYKQLHKLSMAQREKIVNKIKINCALHGEELSKMVVEETGMGRVEHKIIKHQLIAEKTPGVESLTTTAWTGDGGLTLVERGSYGVIGAITPSTNPTATVFCNAIGMIAAGNAVVFAPHPSAEKCSLRAIEIINEAIKSEGGPENLVLGLKNVTIEKTKELMEHRDVEMISATGGPGLVESALRSGKRALGAGAGNPPVFVDETADIEKAAKDILDGATFDNNLPCIAEKEVIVINCVADMLIHHMRENGAYYLDKNEISKLKNLILIEKNGTYALNRKYVGKDARIILEDIGIKADKDVRCIIFESDADDIMVKEELMMPILGIVKVFSVDEGIEVALKLEKGNRHSAHIHSKNVDTLTKYGRVLDTAIYVKNAPSYYALGYNAEGYVTFTIASKTGEGLTSAETFTKSRRCVLSQGLSIR